MSLEPAVEAHQQSEVDENLRAVRAVADRIASEMGVTVLDRSRWDGQWYEAKPMSGRETRSSA